MMKKPSMKRRLRLWLARKHPVHASSGWLGRLKQRLTDPLLWLFNRNNVAKGAALGMFIAFIPLPMQILFASLGAILFRVNLPIAVVLTWITNPFTFVPILYLNYYVGSWFVPNNAPLHLPNYANDMSAWSWLTESWAWLMTLGKPILIGTPIVAVVAASLGYGLVIVLWRSHTWLELKKRKRARHERGR